MYSEYSITNHEQSSSQKDFLTVQRNDGKGTIRSGPVEEGASYKYEYDRNRTDYCYSSQMCTGEMYVPQQKKMANKSTHNVTRQNPSTLLDLSTVRSPYDLPGIVESESSSLDLSDSYFETHVSNDSKSYEDNEDEKYIDNFNRYHNGYDQNFERSITNHYGQKYAAPNGRKGKAVESNEMNLNNNGADVTPCKLIEVAPGQYMRLRGAHETWKAIQNDFYLPCACVCCYLTLFCIQDATYVLCPECQVVNPLDKVVGYDGGVGLGFTIQELAEWQNDIVMNRRF